MTRAEAGPCRAARAHDWAPVRIKPRIGRGDLEIVATYVCRHCRMDAEDALADRDQQLAALKALGRSK